MLSSAGWFFIIAVLAVLGWTLGLHLGQHKNQNASRIGLILGILFLGIWVWLLRHPSLALNIIPLGILSKIEGVAAVPFFMLIVGIARGKSNVPRQRHLTGWACVLGAIYFLHGGIWMLQTTPAKSLAQEVDPSTLVRQSQYYSCVPAACATVLNRLGYPTTEAEMAVLTETRPRTGATLLRAMHGLQQSLKYTTYNVKLIEPDVDQLKTIPLPALTPLQFESTQQHMVTILAVNKYGIRIADPSDGILFFDWPQFETYFRNKVIIVEQDHPATKPIQSAG
ncbi:cysteine peptidase family C39 domain-containing protein [Poriferisphaera sp. WC338]|uniref:cysteine peptidase family C39 domain-containing protein n=1 Tax=Poriferisphaera sp. WC338 TaxID=3425129 RepID=UPI003D816A00